MSKLDQRGVAALEFCLVAAAFFILVFAIFDLGRYAITVQSLHKLANAEARAMMVCCYTPAVLGTPVPATTNCPTPAATSPSGCTGSYLTGTQTQDLAPFLAPSLVASDVTVSINVQGSALVVTASHNNFHMLTPFIWPAAFSNPSASTQVPF
jgi:Flp pilus assembly protein TadG